jgi:hypothetical protein
MFEKVNLFSTDENDGEHRSSNEDSRNVTDWD